VRVNTARRELVDGAALIAALQTGHLAGAALDSYAVEPLPTGSSLRGLRTSCCRRMWPAKRWERCSGSG
jgi:D-3-phosphoglycerate dehydrogenase